VTRAAFATTLEAVQAAGEDFEWYPTTAAMIAAVARHIDEGASSLMDIGAGDGRVLLQLAKKCKHADLYAIEKSNVLIQAQPENVVPVGTDFYQQNLACLPCDYIFSNPPYSQFEAWASTIVESGYAKKAFLVIPRRWKDSADIANALKKRGATARIIYSGDFEDADRRARAIVDIVEVSYPMKGSHGWRSDEVKDPFDTWFDLNVSTFDTASEEDEDQSEYERERQHLARIRKFDTIREMVDGYNEEYERMQENYRAIFRLDHALLKELGVKKDALRDGIKVRMAGLKTTYWTLLFERLDAITSRLSTATRKTFLEKLTKRAAIAFTESNAYAIVLWSIKNANAYFGEQLIALFRELSTFEGVMNYKSNQRVWSKNSGWRYKADDHSHYALDYRIVVERHGGIAREDSFSYRHPGNLSESSHELIADIIAVLTNLGFPSSGFASQSIQWTSGTWEDWCVPGTVTVLFQVKAFKKGTVHLRFMPDAIKALNVEAGRLLGWLHSADEVVTELGYTPEDAKRFYGSTKLIMPSTVRLLMGSPEAPTVEVDESAIAITTPQLAMF